LEELKVVQLNDLYLSMTLGLSVTMTLTNWRMRFA